MRFDFNVLSLATAGQRPAGTTIAPLLNRFLPEIDAARALLLYFKGTRLKIGVSHDQARAALGPPERAYARVTRRSGAPDGKLLRQGWLRLPRWNSWRASAPGRKEQEHPIRVKFAREIRVQT